MQGVYPTSILRSQFSTGSMPSRITKDGFRTCKRTWFRNWWILRPNPRFDNCYRTFWFIELELFHYYVFIVTFTRLILYRLNNATFKFRKGNIDTHANEHLWDYPKSGYLIYVIALYAVLKANILPTSFFLKYVKANIMFTSESS